jgi:hypothetical protein
MNTNGVIQNIVARAAKIDPATLEPSPEYICFANSGITPERMPRKNANPAFAEDAYDV